MVWLVTIIADDTSNMACERTLSMEHWADVLIVVDGSSGKRRLRQRGGSKAQRVSAGGPDVWRGVHRASSKPRTAYNTHVCLTVTAMPQAHDD
jgi:hypothetical protein